MFVVMFFNFAAQIKLLVIKSQVKRSVVNHSPVYKLFSVYAYLPSPP